MILLKLFFKNILASIKDFYEKKRSFFIFGILLILIFILAIIGVFYTMFKYTIVYLPGGYLFAPKMLGIIILFIFIFIILLSFIAAISTFFKNKELKLILPLPLIEKDFFMYSLGKLIYFSSYGTIFILFPIFIAYGLALNFNLYYYLISIIVLIALTIIASIFGVLLFWIINFTIFSLKENYRKIVVLFILTLIAFIGYKSLASIGLKTNSGLSILENMIFNFKFDNLLYPYNWFIKTIYYFQLQNYILSILYVILILSFTYLLYSFSVFLGSKTYLKALENFENLNVNKKTKNISFKSIFRKNKYINLYLKDLLVHVRDPSQWTQIFIFVLLMFAYILIIKGKTNTLLENPYIVSLLTLGGIGIGAFFISAISLRFIYPNISLEGKSFWILKTIPITSWKIFILKFLFFLGIVIIVNFLLLYYYIKNFNFFDNISDNLYILSIFISIYITALYFSFGIFFPNFNETNPSKIATSYGGLLSIFVSNFSILLILSSIYPFLLKYYQNIYKCQNIGFENFQNSIIISSIILFLASIILLYTALLKYKKIEI